MIKWLEDFLKFILALFTQISEEVEKEEPQPIGELEYDIPKFKELPADIQFDDHGEYKTHSGRGEGVIIHYTVSGRTEQAAINVGRYLASIGLGCLILDEKGQFWSPKGWNWMKKWDHHAGKSQWGHLDGLSQYFYGIEVCGWGNHERATGQLRDGFEKFTKAQEKALLDFCLWQLDTNEYFQIPNIAGHAEVGIPLGRKLDPGASLSMSMPDFRKFVQDKWDEILENRSIKASLPPMR